jgi:hypothetical protein
MAQVQSVGDAVVVLRQQVAKQSLPSLATITVGSLLDGYVAELVAMGIPVAGASAASAASTGDAVNALTSQLAAVGGLSGYTRGAIRDKTAQLVAQLQAHGVVIA